MESVFPHGFRCGILDAEAGVQIGIWQGERYVQSMEEISLSDYEKNMSLDTVRQLQGMNQMMKGQFASYPVTSAMVFGVAGGNGLKHIDT